MSPKVPLKRTCRLTSIAAPLAAALLAGCGGGHATTTTSVPAVATSPATTTAEAPKQTASELQAEARQRKKEAAEAKRREAAARRRAAQARRREAAEREAEEHLGHGLGAKTSTFNAENTIGEGVDPPPGAAWYHVLNTVSGRVSGFNINVNFTPSMSPHELISLMSIHNLPQDAELITEHSECSVWRSATLRRLLGSEYAEGFEEPAGERKYAELISTPQPECK